MDEFGPSPAIVLLSDDGEIMTWFIQRTFDKAVMYIGSHGPEGMLSVSQGSPFPEHVGIATIYDY